MRNTKLIISTLIAVVGIIIYFVSVPTVNEKALVHLTVEAGDEELLDNVYFNGYLYNYGSFRVNEQNGVHTNESLSYLEKLDATEDQSLNTLLEKYPDFVRDIAYNPYLYNYYLLNNKEQLILGSFIQDDSDYSINDSTLCLKTLNKETNEIVEDTVQRESELNSDSINIISMYEEYPVIKILYNLSTWPSETTGEKSKLTIGEYNFETKAYSEETLLSEEGSFYDANSNLYNAKNNKLQIIYRFGSESEEFEDSAEPTAYIYNFIEGTLSPFETTATSSFVGNQDQVYTLENEGEQVLLRHYNQTGQEIENEVILENSFPLNLYGDETVLLAEVINDQLFIVQSAVEELHEQDISPTDLQIFDLHSGESLLTGKIEYDTEHEVNAIEGQIYSIDQLSAF